MPSDLRLDNHYEALVRDLIASGRYRDVTEVVQAGLQLLEDRDADLRARRAELEASFEEALADVDAGHALTAEEVRAHLDKRHEDVLRARQAAE